MAYRFKATEVFWERFYALSPEQKEKARQVWEIFKVNPFDPRLRTHKINRLSARFGTTVYSVHLEGGTAVHVFGNEDRDLVYTLTLGKHGEYK